MTDKTLPEAFSDLKPWVETWALDTQNAREAARRASNSEDLKAFYDAMVGKLDSIIEYLNGFPLDNMPPPEARLLCLALSLAEIAPHVELYRGNPRVPYSFEEERFIADHGAVSHYLGDIYAAS